MINTYNELKRMDGILKYFEKAVPLHLLNTQTLDIVLNNIWENQNITNFNKRENFKLFHRTLIRNCQNELDNCNILELGLDYGGSKTTYVEFCDSIVGNEYFCENYLEEFQQEEKFDLNGNLVIN